MTVTVNMQPLVVRLLQDTESDRYILTRAEAERLNAEYIMMRDFVNMESHLLKYSWLYRGSFLLMMWTMIFYFGR